MLDANAIMYCAYLQSRSTFHAWFTHLLQNSTINKRSAHLFYVGSLLLIFGGKRAQIGLVLNFPTLLIDWFQNLGIPAKNTHANKTKKILIKWNENSITRFFYMNIGRELSLEVS